MLASLITVALLASANAAAPARPSRTQIKEHYEKKHASAVKSMDAKFKAGAKSVAPLADDMGYYQWNQYDGACTKDSQVTGIETAAYGMCFMSSDSVYTKSAIAKNTDGSYALTTAYYSDADCEIMTSSTVIELPSSCDTSVNIDGSGTYAYVTGTMSKFSTPSGTAGYTAYNTDNDCDNEENQMGSSSVYVFGTCYEYGFGIYYTVGGCSGNVKIYTDADCSTKAVFDDDDSYGDDDDDDDDDDDANACTMTSSTSYSSGYCDGSAASALVTPSKMLLFAATAAAAVASMF